MIRKIIFTSLILTCLLFTTIAEECFAGAAEELAQAKVHRRMAYYEVPEDLKSTYYGQAEQMYESVVQNYPGTDTALQAQRDLVILYILLEKPADRQTALGKLKSDFATNPKLPAALHWIARNSESLEVRAADKYEVAKSIYQYIIDHCPDSNHAAQTPLDILRGQALSFIDAGNDAAAEATIDKMITDFAGHRRLSSILYSVAKRYEELSKHPQSNTLYQKVIQHCPGSKHAARARMDIRKVNIAQLIQAGDNTAAETEVDSLIADPPTAVHLGDVVARSGQEYYRQGLQYESQGLEAQARACFEKAAATWQKVTLEEAVKVDVAQYSYYLWGDCCRRLGWYAESIQHYQKLADDYPDYKTLWHGLFMIGRNYQSMAKEGLIAKSEANTKTKAAYQRLTETHPDCKAARAANRWLERENSR